MWIWRIRNTGHRSGVFYHLPPIILKKNTCTFGTWCSPPSLSPFVRHYSLSSPPRVGVHCTPLALSPFVHLSAITPSAHPPGWLFTVHPFPLTNCPPLLPQLTPEGGCLLYTPSHSPFVHHYSLSSPLRVVVYCTPLPTHHLSTITPLAHP